MRDDRWLMRMPGGWILCLILFVIPSVGQTVAPEPAFEVAVIRPSATHVQFERNGATETGYGRLAMRDVTVSTCIQFAYEISEGEVTGPASLRSARYDITAKTTPAATEAEMRKMMRTLLRERFGLEFHKEPREMRVYTLVVAKGGVKMKPAVPGEAFFRENSATGTVARAMTMRELATYLSDPLDAPMTDGTGLPGAWDFIIDFTPYVDMQQRDVKPDVVAVLGAALKGELGLEIVRDKRVVEVTVVDRVQAATEN